MKRIHFFMMAAGASAGICFAQADNVGGINLWYLPGALILFAAARAFYRYLLTR